MHSQAKISVDKSTYVQQTRREVKTAVKAAKQKATAASTTASQPSAASSTTVPMSGEKATVVSGDSTDACADRLAAVALDRKLREQEEELVGIAAHRPRRA